jgi:hypothetical protein
VAHTNFLSYITASHHAVLRDNFTCALAILFAASIYITALKLAGIGMQSKKRGAWTEKLTEWEK